MAGVRAAVEERGRGGIPERLAHAPRDDDRAEGDVAGADPLRAGDQVGREAVALAAEPAPEPAEAADHLVRDEQDVALAADALDLGPVAVGRRDHAARADHRLADEPGGALAELVEDPGEVLGIVVRDLCDVADERAVPVADARDAGEGRPVGVRAVVREATRQDHRPLRPADERPVAPDDLGRRVDRLAAARAEEDRGVGDRRQLGHALGEAEGRLVRVVAEDVVRRERPELLADGVGDLRAPVADVREPQAGGRVEVLAPVGVPDAAALAADEHELVPVDLPHRGEGVPEPRRGGPGERRHGTTSLLGRVRRPHGLSGARGRSASRRSARAGDPGDEREEVRSSGGRYAWPWIGISIVRHAIVTPSGSSTSTSSRTRKPYAR